MKKEIEGNEKKRKKRIEEIMGRQNHQRGDEKFPPWLFMTVSICFGDLWT